MPLSEMAPYQQTYNFTLLWSVDMCPLMIAPFSGKVGAATFVPNTFLAGGEDGRSIQILNLGPLGLDSDPESGRPLFAGAAVLAQLDVGGEGTGESTIAVAYAPLAFTSEAGTFAENDVLAVVKIPWSIDMTEGSVFLPDGMLHIDLAR